MRSGVKRKNEESEVLTRNDERTGDDSMGVSDANLDGTPELPGSGTSNANSGNANSAATCCDETKNGDEVNNKERNGSGPFITPGQPPRELDEDEVVPVPEPLLQLKNNGLSFVGVPKDTWSFDGWAAKLQKRATLTFALDAPCTSAEILEGFERAGVDINTICAVQRKLSTRSWAISFTSREARDIALGHASITVAGCPVFLGDAENRTVIVKVYEAPDEMPDTVVIGRLSAYGHVFVINYMNF